ncbi:hypothetical protein PROFUN_05236 [Planoprotostelium fungivorum]|uniref:USP domain-containing protein n=1 Tax=Planoprotostelium fungivorum TaxID=1890364 RepID=A0A2P6NRT8_9EUKA|nr:hypothetical protein PROFUN_05236 [Planoprotostelium fungivorum]
MKITEEQALQHNVTTIQNLFQGTSDLSQSMIVDVLKNRHNRLEDAIDTLLTIQDCRIDTKKKHDIPPPRKYEAQKHHTSDEKDKLKEISKEPTSPKKGAVLNSARDLIFIDDNLPDHVVTSEPIRIRPIEEPVEDFMRLLGRVDDDIRTNPIFSTSPSGLEFTSIEDYTRTEERSLTTVDPHQPIPTIHTYLPHRSLSSVLSYSSLSGILPPSLPVMNMMWKQENSLMQSVMDKGLTNKSGQNNCFLNVIIQSLWHLRTFRRSFFSHQDHTHYSHIGRPDAKDRQVEDSSCPYCALETTFSAYYYGDEKVLPPDALRMAMACISSQKFQLGQTDDATELFDALLLCLHQCIRGTFDDGGSCRCLIHRIFGMELIEFMTCSCGTVSRHFPFRQFIHYIPANKLRDVRSSALIETPEGAVTSSIPFDRAARMANVRDPQKCPREGCGREAEPRCYLTNSPEVVSVCIIWPTDTPPLDMIYDILDSITPTIDPQNMFDSSNTSKLYNFRGMVCYYGKHYNAYFKNRRTHEWMVFDDTTVKMIGSWKEVRSKVFHREVLMPTGSVLNPVWERYIINVRSIALGRTNGGETYGWGYGQSFRGSHVDNIDNALPIIRESPEEWTNRRNSL